MVGLHRKASASFERNVSAVRVVSHFFKHVACKVLAACFQMECTKEGHKTEDGSRNRLGTGLGAKNTANDSSEGSSK
jgi:hypothetical protein